jgi:lipoprotein NlpD
MSKDILGDSRFFAARAFTARLAVAGVVAVALLFSTACTRKIAAPVIESAAVPKTDAWAGGVAAENGIHIVRKGDTVQSISRQYGVAVRDIVAWNNLANPHQIEIDRPLRIVPEQGSQLVTAGAVETIPVRSETETGDGTTPPFSTSAAPAVKSTPRGGKEPYSDEAWARLGDAGTLASPPPQSQPQPQPPLAQPAAEPPAPALARYTPSRAWIWPVKGKIIAGFGVPGGNNRLSNKGIDIAGTPGTPVLAAAAGKVSYSGDGLRGYGKLIIIAHDDDFLTAYAHNQTLLVKENDVVSQGQKIAELGSTGATRPKLHFELRKKGQPLDPLKYLPVP